MTLRMTLMTLAALGGLGGLALVAGCQHDEPAAPEHAHEEAPAQTNRVEIPASVRSNLGITFANVERRAVASMLRAPGRFELLPSARREHRTAMTGRVDLLVEQYQRVEAGSPLYRLDSPQWRDLQRELAEADAATDIAEARLQSFAPLMEAHRVHEDGLRQAVELWSGRVEQLRELGEAGGGRAGELADAQANLTESRAAFGEVMEKDAELQLQRSETERNLHSARARFDLLLTTAAAIMGVPRESLLGDQQSWRGVGLLEIRATRAGVVERVALTSGAWADEGELVMSIVDPAAVRFRAVGLQSDLSRLQPGLPATIVPPTRAGAPAREVGAAIATTLEIGLDADPEQRTIELLAVPSRGEAWARPGVAAFLEITTERTAQPELAIPMSAVVRDGLTAVIFRRDPANADRAIRLEADLGMSDGRWVVINSGVKEGDEIVLDGVYQLLLATSGSMQKGGHFHADGTFHAEEDE